MDDETPIKVAPPSSGKIPYGIGPGTRIYVCRRCQASFTKGGGVPDVRFLGLGRCNACIALRAEKRQRKDVLDF